jgi:hypothetical protein
LSLGDQEVFLEKALILRRGSHRQPIWLGVSLFYREGSSLFEATHEQGKPRDSKPGLSELFFSNMAEVEELEVPPTLGALGGGTNE